MRLTVIHLPGIAILDVGRHIADELIHITCALNDLLARATRLVTLTNAVMMEQMAQKMGMESYASLPPTPSVPYSAYLPLEFRRSSLPSAASISPELTKYEIDTIQPVRLPFLLRQAPPPPSPPEAGWLADTCSRSVCGSTLWTRAALWPETA